jgi:hypothetical protein
MLQFLSGVELELVDNVHILGALKHQLRQAVAGNRLLVFSELSFLQGVSPVKQVDDSTSGPQFRCIRVA